MSMRTIELRFIKHKLMRVLIYTTIRSNPDYGSFFLLSMNISCSRRFMKDVNFVIEYINNTLRPDSNDDIDLYLTTLLMPDEIIVRSSR